MKAKNPESKVLKILLKDFTINHTVTSLAKELKLSRVGVWKLLKRINSEKFINLSKVNSGKTSTYTVKLNWNCPLLEKNLALLLTEEALNNERWTHNFAELENKTDFLILYGSILHSPREANDIDILGIVSKKKSFIEIEKTIKEIQKNQIKKIHIINFTSEEFRKEIKNKNKAFIDAIKKGVILFGQDKFLNFMKIIGEK